MNELVDMTTGEVIAADAPLTAAEEAKLARCEADIEAGLLQAWRALRTIWQERLYRVGYSGFDKYCQAKWGITAARAHQLIDAANLVDYVSTNGGHESLIPNERTARAVLEIEPDKRLPVLMLAAKAADGKIDSGWVRSAAEVHEDTLATGGYVDDGEGSMTEAERAVIDTRLERAKRQRQHIRDNGKDNKLDEFEGRLDLARNWLAGLEHKFGWHTRVKIIVYGIDREYPVAFSSEEPAP
jgi:hypothetical protein